MATQTDDNDDSYSSDGTEDWILNASAPGKRPYYPPCQLCNSDTWFCHVIDPLKLIISKVPHVITFVRGVDITQFVDAYLCEECCKKHLEYELLYNYTCPICQELYALWDDAGVSNDERKQGDGVATFYKGNGRFHSGCGSVHDGNVYDQTHPSLEKDLKMSKDQTICDKCVTCLISETKLKLVDTRQYDTWY